jgi:hypothetical protein
MTKHKVTTRDERDQPQLWMRRHDEYHEPDATGQ